MIDWLIDLTFLNT